MDKISSSLAAHARWLESPPDGTRFSVRDFEPSALIGAYPNLRGADLRRADLYGANLRNAILEGANLLELPVALPSGEFIAE